MRCSFRDNVCFGDVHSACPQRRRARAAYSPNVQYRPLGHTGVQLSVLGLGTNQFGRVVDAAGAKSIIDRAQELGVNFIDSAESYGGGMSEELLGKALAGRRDEFVVATKTGAGSDPGRLTRKRILQRLDASLKRLATDFIDVYYMHFPDASTPLEESLGVLDDAVRAGKIRWVLGEDATQAGPRLPGDTRAGSRAAIAAAAKACRAHTLAATATATPATASGALAAGMNTGAATTLYDCRGRAGALLRAAA